MPNRLILALAAALLTALPASVSAATGDASANWADKVTLSNEGYAVLGNPNAKVRLVEFISFTCPHCADFNAEATQALRSGLVRDGSVAVESRPFLRNGLDIVASLLALCGPRENFFRTQDSLLAAQEAWMREPADPGYKQRWVDPDFAKRMKAIAVDLGLYAIAEKNGESPETLDHCLADESLFKKLAVDTDAAVDNLKVEGTPSFLINGKLQTVYSWDELRPLLEAAAKAG